MKQLVYQNLDLEIGPAGPDGYPVAILNSPGGQARGRLALPEDLARFDQALAALQQAILETPGEPAKQLAQEVGAALFQALFHDELLSLYDVSVSLAREAEQGLRIKLRINAPELTGIPWEFLFDPRRKAFVGLSRQTPLIRYLEVGTPDRPLEVEPPLRVLGVAASPADLDPLDLTGEKARVEAAVAPLRDEEELELAWLEPPTWRTLQTAMQQGPWHVLHFVGHAEFDPASGEGSIILAGDDGQALRLSATQLADLLADQRTLRLVVLNACEGARGDEADVFSSMAATLVQRGLPAVVAMQYPISDAAALEFSTSFYAALAALFPVDAAVAEARKAISLAEADTLEWATPVLHLRAPDGVIFAPPPEAEGAAGGGISIGTFNVGGSVVMGSQNTVIGDGSAIKADGETGSKEPTKPQPADEQSAGWLRRLFGRGAGEQDGHTVIDSQNVLIGNRSIQLNVGGRNITVPVFAIALALIALLAILIFPFVEPLWNPSQMTGSFKIAVADFGLLEDGRMQPSALGADLSQTTFAELSDQYAAVRATDSPIANVAVWHDSQGRDVKNVKFGLIEGATSEERADNAAALAERINADMVIYGFLTSEERPEGLALEFYFRSPTVAGEPDTATGLYRLGLPIASSVPVTDEANAALSRAQISGPLTTRAQAIFWLTQAMTYDFAGQHEEALAVLKEADEQLTDWDDQEGKEVFYTFMGRAAYYARQIDEAERAAERALEINPDYVNAHMLRAYVHMDRAQLFFAQGRELTPEEAVCTDLADFAYASPSLEAAIADAEAAVSHLQTAVALAPDSFWPEIEAYARMNLGLAERVAALAYTLDNRLEAAADALATGETELQQALTEISVETQPQYYAWTQMGLGVNYRMQAYLAAVDAFLADQDEDAETAAAARAQEAELLRKSIAAHDACIAQEDATLAYPVFQEKVLTCSCIPFRASAEEALAALEEEGP
jgi:tetratricopeptide (TPR) repeat protein